MRNKPKNPRLSPEPATPGPSTSRPHSPDDGRSDLDFTLPGRVRADAAEISSGVTSDNLTPGTSHGKASVSVTPMDASATTRPVVGQSPLRPYVQTPSSKLSLHDADGLRSYKGRFFADVASDDAQTGIETVMVVFHDAMKAYRAKLPTERAPSAPPLYRIADTNTWSSQKPIAYYENSMDRVYTTSNTVDAQGYYAVHEQLTRKHSAPFDHIEYQVTNRDIGFALKDAHSKLVRVDPLEARGDPSVPLKLAHWTDGDIWSAYRLRESEALVFRSEAEAQGRPPTWATRFEDPDTYQYLIHSLRWSHPHKSPDEHADILRSYNLTIAQQSRLRKDMEHGVFPEWAEQHKQLTQSNDDQRLSQIAAELDPYILRLRNEGQYLENKLPDAELRYESEFLESYLMHAGYKRNMRGLLYRTDIPGMFRADLRTPFELARDKRLFRLKGNGPESTTKLPFSTTFGLDDASNYTDFEYYSQPRRYNSQANRYPGHASSDSDSSDGGRYGTGNESDNSFEMDYSRDYPLRRRNQDLSFLYVIDTRGIEVVPQAENAHLSNLTFWADPMEGQISMPSRGISAERIWLVHSDKRRAARVEDIFRAAGENAEAIEQATWDGTVSRHPSPYDDLIEKVASSGGVILDLPKGTETFANDIIWPVPEHYRP
ncbi:MULTISPECIES: hypothetical protein [unclassified Pseudomonas]|uniref:hypothetical protein n=1 Tax=unclassified Pseudomonas TaxID=196821 RepID=UPI001B3261D1|nr:MULTISPECIES: hypothetical protein [unclassified Pseudomonas]MBP5947087.1 hypothetical protein [Pseudomonas sp. P9(2020)]MBZ9565240.1 hypothetical protein [Pseudomonas sp. P116]